MQKGIILIYTDSTEKFAKSISISGCPVTRMNVRWATQWKGWQKSVFIPYGLIEAKMHPELYAGVNLLIYMKSNTEEEAEEKVCGLVS